MFYLVSFPAAFKEFEIYIFPFFVPGVNNSEEQKLHPPSAIIFVTTPSFMKTRFISPAHSVGIKRPARTNSLCRPTRRPAFPRLSGNSLRHVFTTILYMYLSSCPFEKYYTNIVSKYQQVFHYIFINIPPVVMRKTGTPLYYGAWSPLKN